jgi:hypothetical protein
MVAIGSVASSAWAAHPSLLVPSGELVVESANAKINGSGGKSTLQTVSGKTVTATSLTSTAKLSSTTKGTFQIVFLGAAAAGVNGTGLSSPTAGEITAKGEAHLAYDNMAPLAAAIAFLLEPVHFACSATLLVVSGCSLGLVKPINTAVAAGASYEVFQKQSVGKTKTQNMRSTLAKLKKPASCRPRKTRATRSKQGSLLKKGN